MRTRQCKSGEGEFLPCVNPLTRVPILIGYANGCSNLWRSIMHHTARLLSALPLAASFLWAGSAYGADPVVKNTTTQRGLSDVDISKIKPLVNPLPPPDMSKSKAEPDYMLKG